MEKAPHSPWSLILSIRLYRALLAVYPFEFRQEYGGPMLQAFRDCTRRALHLNGTTGLLSMWWWTILDTAQTAIEQYLHRGVELSKEYFIKLSGWSLMTGGLAVMFGWLAGSRPEYNRFNATSLVVDRYANALELPLIVISLLLLSVGFTGLFLRYGRGAGAFGRASLVLGSLSGVVSAAGVIGLEMYDREPWWSIFFLGMTVQYLGLTLFGIANLRQRALPRWNGLPLLAGGWVPTVVFASLITEQVVGRWVEWPGVVFLIILLLNMAGVAGLGYLLQSDAQPAGMETVSV